MPPRLDEKHPSLRKILRKLQVEGRGWALIDHWEVDPFAIGVARPPDLRRLVYLSTYGEPAGRCSYECEIPDGPEPHEYAVAASGTAGGLPELLAILEGHLGTAP